MNFRSKVTKCDLKETTHRICFGRKPMNRIKRDDLFRSYPARFAFLIYNIIINTLHGYAGSLYVRNNMHFF